MKHYDESNERFVQRELAKVPEDKRRERLMVLSLAHLLTGPTSHGNALRLAESMLTSNGGASDLADYLEAIASDFRQGRASELETCTCLLARFEDPPCSVHGPKEKP